MFIVLLVSGLLWMQASGFFCIPSEICCNSMDDNCNGAVDEGCAFGPEICDGLDNNCDGITDEGCPPSELVSTTEIVATSVSPGDMDMDQDSYTPNQGDCNDTRSDVSPGSPEIMDGLDNDCNNIIDDVCGNALVDPGEECDDGNTVGGDGCDANCNAESSYYTTSSPETSLPTTSGPATSTSEAETSTAATPLSTFAELYAATTDLVALTETTLSSSTLTPSSTTNEPFYDSTPTTMFGVTTVSTGHERTTLDLGSVGATITEVPGSSGASSSLFYEHITFQVSIVAIIFILATVTVMFVLVRKLKHSRRELADSKAVLENELELANMDIKMMESAWLLDWDDIELHARPFSKGAYGEVWRGTYRERWDVAVKVVHVRMKNAKDELSTQSEIKVLQRMRHPRLVLFIGAGKTPQGHVFLAMEYMEIGSLNEMLLQDSTAVPMSWDLCLSILRDICDGVAYIHSNATIHRDMKSSNILLAKEKGETRAKVADFGLSQIMNFKRFDLNDQMLNSNASTKETASLSSSWDTSSESSSETSHSTSYTATMSTMCGTATHMAPELMLRNTLRRSRYSNKVDIFGLGIIMWELLERKKPWAGLNWHYQIFKKVRNGLRPTISSSTSHMDTKGASPPQSFVILMMSCWSQDASDRPSIDLLQQKMSRSDWKPIPPIRGSSSAC